MAATQPNTMKTYSGWLGKIIGIRLGAPFEGWDDEKIAAFFGDVKGYVVNYDTFAADDDSNGPLFFTRAVLDYQTHNITPTHVAQTFLNCIPNEHGFFWWGRELSSEHTAYRNLQNGIEAPLSGSLQQNGKELSEQIGGQIFIDGFALIAQDNTRKAVKMAEASAKVTHDGEGVMGAKFIAACISLAYKYHDIDRIIQKAFTYIDPNSTYYEVVNQMYKLHKEGYTFEETFSYLKKHYWKDKYQGVCHIIPNAGIIAIALLYGDNDYVKSVSLACQMGFDTDCNVGNVGCILGVMCGIQDENHPHGIPAYLIQPINDTILASSILGSQNIQTITNSTNDFLHLHDENYQDESTNITHFPFLYPYGIQGFKARTNYRNGEVHLRVIPTTQTLRIGWLNMHPHTSITLFKKTYYTPNDLHDARYEPAFSPTVYPGDKIVCKLKHTDNVTVKLFYKNSADQIKELPATKDNDTLIATIDKGEDIVKEVGMNIYAKDIEDSYFGNQEIIDVEQFLIIHEPRWFVDCKKLYFEDYSLQYTRQKELLAHTHYLANCQNIEITSTGLKLTNGEKIFTGLQRWNTYRLRVKFSKTDETTSQIYFFNQGILNSYILEISDSEVMFVLQRGDKRQTLMRFCLSGCREFDVSIGYQDNALEIDVNGVKMKRLCKKAKHVHGGIGFGVSFNGEMKIENYSVEYLGNDDKTTQ